MTVAVWTFFLAALIVQTFGDFYIKQWSLDAQSWKLALGVVIYMISTLLWANTLKYIPLVKAYFLYNMMAIISVFFIGIYMFKEAVTLKDYIGIALAIGAMFLLTD